MLTWRTNAKLPLLLRGLNVSEGIEGSDVSDGPNFGRVDESIRLPDAGVHVVPEADGRRYLGAQHPAVEQPLVPTQTRLQQTRSIGNVQRSIFLNKSTQSMERLPFPFHSKPKEKGKAKEKNREKGGGGGKMKTKRKEEKKREGTNRSFTWLLQVNPLPPSDAVRKQKKLF